MRKIIVYGGAFNPVTKAHYNIIKKISELKDVFKVYIVPVGDFYNKKELISAKDRINMLKEFKNDKVVISDIEVNSNKQLKTIETLDIINEINKDKDCEIYLVVGSDNLVDLESWYRAKDLIGNYRLLVVRRKDYKPLKELVEANKFIYKYKDKITEINIDNNDLSSTNARDLILSNNLSLLKDVLTDKTVEYILNNNLYKK